MNIKVKRGITILEVLIAISIMTMFSTLKFIEIKKDSEKILSENIASQLKQIAGATNAFINLKYKDIIEGKTDNSYDMSCPNSSTCKIKISTLENEKLLPNNYSQKNIFGSTYDIILKKEGNAPNYMINGVVLLNDSLKIKKGQSTPNKVINGMALQKIGMDGAVSDDKGDLNGYYGSWKRKLSDFGIANKEGLLAVNVGYSSNMYSIYLRRDGSLPMTGDLNLDKHNINNIQDFNAFGDGNVKGKINADGNIESKGEIIAGSWIRAKNGYGDVISIGGDSSGNDYEIFLNTPKPLSIHGLGGDVKTLRLAVSGSIASSGNIHADGRLSAGEYLSLKGVATIGQSCPDNSLIAKDATGAILACTNGLWQLSVADALPIGVPQPWPSLTPPKGWMIADGRAFDKARNPKLAVAYPSGRLPDLRGYFIRGLDTTNSRDPNRSVLSVQEDAMQRIYGEMRTDGASNYATGPFKVLYRDGTNWSGGRGASHRFDFDSARVTRTAPETRPKNIAFVYIIQEG